MHKAKRCAKGEYLLTPEYSGEALRVAMHVKKVHMCGSRQGEKRKEKEVKKRGPRKILALPKLVS